MVVCGIWIKYFDCLTVLNRLTPKRLRHYSGEMIEDFSLLAQKIDQLAELTQLLRRENAVLRAETVLLGEQNSELRQRMQQAHERVADLLSRIPDPEAASDIDVDDKAISEPVTALVKHSNVVA